MRQRIINWVSDHRIIGVLASLAVFVLIAFLVWGMVFRGDGKDKLVSGEPGGVGVPEYTTFISGRVIDTADEPVAGALVRVSGPFRSTEAATTYETLTDDGTGQYRVDLPLDGEYDLFVSADGFELSVLISGQDIEEIVGDFTVGDIVLKKRQEVVPQRGTDGFVFGEGVWDEEGVYRVLLLHGIISSRDEVVDIFPDTMTGQGWSTFVRDGQSVSVRPITYDDEPAWHVVLQPGRADGLTDVFIQKACGNISAPPGEKPPTRREVITPTPGPTLTPVPSPTPSVTPTPTPRATSTPTPSPTPTPTQSPQLIFGCPDFLEHGSELFTRVGSVVANRPVTWNVTGANVLSSTDTSIVLQANEGAHVVVKAKAKQFDSGWIVACDKWVPVSEEGATPEPLRTPAPTPTPTPPGTDPTPTPQWTPPPP